MTEDLNHQNLSADADSAILYELFEEALHLHDTGNSYESVLLKCPQLLRQELQQQVEGATHLQLIAQAMVKPRNSQQQSVRRAEFLRAVQTMKGGSSIVTSEPSLLEQITDALQSFLDKLNGAVTQFSPRFSPALAMIALLLIGSVGVGTAAAQSLPGDMIYPVKEAFRETRVAIAPPSQKEETVQEIEMERRKDNAQAAINRPNVITVTQDLRFYQKGDSVWSIGGQTVLPGYPVDPYSNPGDVRAMELVGDPQPGDLVELTYEIIPGKPNLVYGVRLVVVEPAVPPTPASTPIPGTTPEQVPTPTATAELNLCEPSPPAGWIVYRVQQGDTLSSLSPKVGKPVAFIKQVNCLRSDMILLGGNLYLPYVVGVTDGPTEQVYALPTSVPYMTVAPVATSTEVLLPTPEATPTVELIVTATDEGVGASGDETGSPTPTAEEIATEAASTAESTVLASETPVPNATFTPTPESTATSNGASSGTDTPISATTAAATETPVTETPATSTQTPKAGTPGAEETATLVETPTANMTPTDALVPTDTPVPAETTPIATATVATPIIEPATDVPVETPTLESSGEEDKSDGLATVAVEATTDSATPVPTSIPPTPEPPTPEPPTPEPPTPVSAGGESTTGDGVEQSVNNMPVTVATEPAPLPPTAIPQPTEAVVAAEVPDSEPPVPEPTLADSTGTP